MHCEAAKMLRVAQEEIVGLEQDNEMLRVLATKAQRRAAMLEEVVRDFLDYCAPQGGVSQVPLGPFERGAEVLYAELGAAEQTDGTGSRDSRASTAAPTLAALRARLQKNPTHYANMVGNEVLAIIEALSCSCSVGSEADVGRAPRQEQDNDLCKCGHFATSHVKVGGVSRWCGVSRCPCECYTLQPEEAGDES